MSEYRNDFRGARKEATWTFWRVLGLGVIALVVLGFVSFGLTMLFRPAQIIDQVTKPEKVIANYEWFRETYNDTKALDGQIVTAQAVVDEYTKILPENREDWGRADRSEYSRLQSIVFGLRNQRTSAVNDYNARSSMITRSLFKGSGIPARLEIFDDTTVEVWE